MSRRYKKMQSKKTITKKTHRVVVDANTPQKLAIRAFDNKDEEQILQSMQGLEYFNELAYKFESKEGEQVGISWAGAKDIAKTMVKQGAEITMGEPNVILTDYGWAVIVSATSKIGKGKMNFWGAFEQSRNMSTRSGSVLPDKFALPKAMSKAQRNALRAIIPETLIKRMLKIWLKQGRVGTVKEADVPKEVVTDAVITKEKPFSIVVKPSGKLECSKCNRKVDEKTLERSQKLYGLDLCYPCMAKQPRRSR